MLPLPDESGRLKAIHTRHVHVQDDGGKIFPEQTAQGFLARSNADDVLVQLRQHHFEREPLVGTIVHHEDAYFVLRRIVVAAIARHHRTNHCAEAPEIPRFRFVLYPSISGSMMSISTRSISRVVHQEDAYFVLRRIVVAAIARHYRTNQLRRSARSSSVSIGLAM